MKGTINTGKELEVRRLEELELGVWELGVRS
jgi:hypothetical protein